MRSERLLAVIVWLALCLPITLSCSAQAAATQTPGEAGEHPSLAVPASHSSKAAPDYAVVFPQDKVNQITIVIPPENWQAMQANMKRLYGERRGGQNNAPGEPGGFPAGGGFGGRMFPSEKPMWVTATVQFNGETWEHVGVRYKGNSSLRSAWDSGTSKLPFKLDFDEFEDQYPEIKNQRFYGFKQLSFANGFGDPSYLREAVTYDLLAAAGLVTAETAYYQVAFDYGEGPKTLGLYTAVEVIDDTVIPRAFKKSGGNIYEADGPAASLAFGTVGQIPTTFQKENNKQKADWSDVELLYNILHSDKRTTDARAWRASLEAVFDVPVFLKWLALSAVLQHWDTYGGMTHNYYLYHDPTTGKLTWISWDHNLVLGGAGGFGGRGSRGNVTFDKKEVGTNWPLIRYLLDEPVYYAQYVGYLREITRELFVPDRLAARYLELAQLIAPYAAQETSQASFESAVRTLTERTYERAKAAADFISSN